MKVLVIGGTGLISQSIVEQLAERGDEVHLFNRGITEALTPAGVTRTTGERAQIDSFRSEMERRGFDCVIDMCGYTPAEAEALVEAAGGVVAQVIFCSTTDVFEKGRGPYPLTEKSPRGARATFPYAVGKVASEIALEDAAGRGAFALTTIRPAQTYGGLRYGPNHPLGHREYNWWRLATGRPIILHGDGSSLWCACYAPDVAAAFVAAVGNSGVYNRDYITAGDEVITWKRYWEIAAEALGGAPLLAITLPTSVLERVFGADAEILVENFQYNNVFDCSRAKDELGFRYRTDLATGFGWLAANFDERWRQVGESERGTSFAVTYERCIQWWERVTANAGLEH